MEDLSVGINLKTKKFKPRFIIMTNNIVLIFVPILTYSYESWVMTERMRLQMQAFKVKFLQKIKRVTIFDKMRNIAI